MRLPTHRSPTQPGEILLEEWLKPMKLTQLGLAKKMGVAIQARGRLHVLPGTHPAPRRLPRALLIVGPFGRIGLFALHRELPAWLGVALAVVCPAMDNPVRAERAHSSEPAQRRRAKARPRLDRRRHAGAFACARHQGPGRRDAVEDRVERVGYRPSHVPGRLHVQARRAARARRQPDHERGRARSGRAHREAVPLPVRVLGIRPLRRRAARWRRAVALAVYVFPRAGELRALRWEDVDLKHGMLHVHRSRLRDEREDKGTKTKAARRFAIEPAALALLKTMHAESGGTGHVIELPNDKHLARDFRLWIKTAGLDRAELRTSPRTRKAITFHDLRATGLTWLAVRGDDPLKIMQRAGHADFGTTQGYIRMAEAVREGFGDVFPPLPPLAKSEPVDTSEEDEPPPSSEGEGEPVGPMIGPTDAQVIEIAVEAPGIERAIGAW